VAQRGLLDAISHNVDTDSGFLWHRDRAIGRELREWAPEGVGALKAAAAVVVLPAIVGMAVILLAYQPMATNAMEARAAEGVFWIFAALGALVGSARPARTDVLDVRRVDWLFALVAVLALRVLALGIPLAQ